MKHSCLIFILLFFPVFTFAETRTGETERLLKASLETYAAEDYQRAIQYASEVLKLDPDNAEAYRLLCISHISLSDFDEAIAYGKVAHKLAPADTSILASIKDAEEAMYKQYISSVFQILISAILLLYLFYFIRTQMQTWQNTDHQEFVFVPLVFLTSVLYPLYLLFFHYAPFLHSLNVKIPAQDIAPIIRTSLFEHDGIEGFVLFGGIYIFVLSAIFIYAAFTTFQNKRVTVSIAIVSTAGALLMVNTVGFYPPSSSFPSLLTIAFPLQLLVITGLFLLLRRFHPISPKKFFITYAILLIPICFLQTEPISMFDYQFVLTPALKLLHGQSIREIYMQYDLLLSLVTLFWMKLNLDITYIHIIGQVSYYLFFVGLYLFSRRFFLNKNWVVPFLFCIILVKMYSLLHDSVSIIQSTPLRLELWLLLVFVCYIFGWKHWLLALVTGFILLIHRNFGLLYLSAYLILLFFNFIINGYDALSPFWEKHTSALKAYCLSYFSSIWINIFIIGVFIGLTILLYGSLTADSARLYQQIGIGMIPISRHSFYWYIPVLLTITIYLLLQFRNRLNEAYLSTAAFFVFLSASSAMYFYGRSHEHNILNICGTLLFCFFIVLDILYLRYKTTQATEHPARMTKILNTVPIALMLLIICFYSDRMRGKTNAQHAIFKTQRYRYPLDIPSKADMDLIRSITQNSKKVYFLCRSNDFLYYYYGGYAPPGYYSPHAAWVKKDEMLAYFNMLLSDGYYLIVPKKRPNTSQPDVENVQESEEILRAVSYNERIEKGDFIFIRKK